MLLCSATFVACDDDDNEVKGTDVTIPNLELYSHDTYQINAENSGVWVSDNPSVASIEGDVLHANHVGNAVVTGRFYSFKVAVLPKYTLFEEPVLAWGADAQTVKDAMTSYTLATAEGSILSYVGLDDDAADAFIYTFTANGLASAQVVLSGDYTVSVTRYLDERYERLEGTDELAHEFYFRSLDGKTDIHASMPTEGNWTIDYTPAL